MKAVDLAQEIIDKADTGGMSHCQFIAISALDDHALIREYFVSNCCDQPLLGQFLDSDIDAVLKPCHSLDEANDALLVAAAEMPLNDTELAIVRKRACDALADAAIQIVQMRGTMGIEDRDLYAESVDAILDLVVLDSHECSQTFLANTRN